MALNKVVAATAVVVALAPGLGFAQPKSFDVPAFTALDIQSGINAEVSIGPQAITAESRDPGHLDALRIEVRNGKLTASVDWGPLSILDFREREITLRIVAPSLESVQASSGADVSAVGMTGGNVVLSASSGANLNVTEVQGETFRLDASSGADLVVAGACTSAMASVSSGANLDASGLKCAKFEVEASSGSDARVFASQSIRAEASSGAGIEVSGNPGQIDRETSGGGDIELTP